MEVLSPADWTCFLPRPDYDLVQRAIAGEPEALAAIVKNHEPRVTRLLVRILGPRDDLEDLVQTVFFEVCRSLCRFRGDSSLSTYIGGITIQISKRSLRPTAWLRRRGPMPKELIDSSASPEQRATSAEQLRRARWALERLSKKKRIAFILYAVEGMTVESISTHTGSSVAAIYAQISSARKELRALAQGDDYLRELLEEGRGEHG